MMSWNMTQFILELTTVRSMLLDCLLLMNCYCAMVYAILSVWAFVAKGREIAKKLLWRSLNQTGNHTLCWVGGELC